MRFRKSASERGQGLAEYALILVLVSIVVIVILSLTGQKITEIFCDITLKIGGSTPNIAACAAPRVTIVGVSGGATVPNHVAVEAILQDNKGGTGSNIKNVKFYIDGNLVQTEYTSKYCLTGGDSTCPTYNFSDGPHTLRVVATDADDYTGETSVTFTVN